MMLRTLRTAWIALLILFTVLTAAWLATCVYVSVLATCAVVEPKEEEEE